MTTKLSDTTITNKLIAEFMEYPYRYSDTGIISGTERWEVGIGHWWCTVDELLFDSSWDWLMPVVEKIEYMLHDDIVITIEYKTCVIPVVAGTFATGGFDISVVGSTKLDACYKAVVEFIKWYNKQKIS